MASRPPPFILPMPPGTEGRISEYLSELASGASIVGVGEMTHGSREIYLWRERVLRQLVEAGSLRTIVFESGIASTAALDEFVCCDSHSAEEALAETGFWSMANAETAEFARWLRSFNQGLPQSSRVRVYGCDIQSLDALVALARRTIPTAEQPKLLSALPTDADLNSTIEAIFTEAAGPDPDLERIESLQRTHQQHIESWRPLVEDFSAWIESWFDRRGGDSQYSFPARWLGRLFRQTISYFAFEDAGQRRDAFMAENVLAIRQERLPEQLAFVAANWHVSKAAIALTSGELFPTTGSHLKESLGDGYRCVGSAFHHGEYLAITDKESRPDDVASALQPPSDSIEHHLERYSAEAGASELLCDFWSAREQEDLLPWGSAPTMNIGQAGHPTDVESTFIIQQPHMQFDALYFVRATSPISILPGYYKFHAQERQRN